MTRGFAARVLKNQIYVPALGHRLQARYSRPYEIKSTLSDVNCVVKTSDRHNEKRVRHIDMLKAYFVECNRDLIRFVSTFALSHFKIVLGIIPL